MKRSFILLGISASAALFAGKCSEPCCKPIGTGESYDDAMCCEYYTPPYYCKQCDAGIFVTCDFLYWYGRENTLSYGSVVETVPVVSTFPYFSPQTVATVPIAYKYLDAMWKPGVRVGIGWNIDCDGFDLYADWTYYKGEGKGSTSVPIMNALAPPVGDQAILSNWTDSAVNLFSAVAPTPHPFTLFNALSAKWDFTFNQIDLEMGRKYCLGEYCTMRPYVGLRSEWTRTKFTLRGRQNAILLPASLPSTNGTIVFDARDAFSNQNWGIGFLAGFQPAFYFTESFSLYANADAALLWGKFENKTKRNYSSTVTNGVTFSTTVGGGVLANGPDLSFRSSANGNFTSMQPMLDLSIGLCWETSWCEHYGFVLDASWEHHVLFAHNTRIRATNNQESITSTNLNGTIVSGYLTSISLNLEEMINTVAMGGFVLKASFSF